MSNVQEKIARRAQAKLEPGECIQVAVPALGSLWVGALAAAPFAVALAVGLGWLGLGGAVMGAVAGAAAVVLLRLFTPSRSLVVTDRRIVVFGSRPGGASPTTILGSAPRGTLLGPATGRSHRPRLPVKVLVDRRYFPELHRADALAAAPPWAGPPPPPRRLTAEVPPGWASGGDPRGMP